MRYVDWVIPEKYFADQDQLRQVRMWAIITGIFTSYSFLAAFQNYAMDMPLSTMIVIVTGSAVAFLILLLKLGVRYLLLAHAFIAVAYISFTGGLFHCGGIKSVFLVWSTTPPLGALLLMNKKNAWPWVFMSSATLAIVFAIQAMGYEIYNEVNPKNELHMIYFNMGAFLIIIFVAVLSFDNIKNSLMKKLEEERNKSEELLLNILPAETAKELKQKGQSDAKYFDEVTVLFTDFQDFTQISQQLSPKELVGEINECFKAFDQIMDKYGIEKIKTIGDAYMAAGGLPVPNKTNAKDVVEAALEMRDWMLSHRKQKGEGSFEIRIGIHTGPVVAGIVGIRKFQYDIWGDTVNTASRMESNGEVGKVNISGATYELVKDQFACEHRGKIAAKGKGEIDMYFVEESGIDNI